MFPSSPVQLTQKLGVSLVRSSRPAAVVFLYPNSSGLPLNKATSFSFEDDESGRTQAGEFFAERPPL
jgi:hypothetical protein